ncbi:MAG: YceI family protein [Pseudomonadales bacterium]|nr:YceI family protein [Pseudomonadales bacterium]
MTKTGLFLMLLLATLPGRAAEYVIDTRGGHASIVFKYKHIGISWLTGEFREFSGRFNWDPDNPEASSVVVEIDPASLDSNHAERDKHVRGEDYLNVEKYPEAAFRSTRVESKSDDRATIYGDLTLHGQTHEIAIDASLVGRGDDPWGGYRAGFQGTTTIDTEQFGFSMPPTNRVHLELYIEGIRQDG